MNYQSFSVKAKDLFDFDNLIFQDPNERETDNVDEESDNETGDSEDDDDSCGEWVEDETSRSPITLNSNYREIVDKVVKIVKFFRKSAVRNELLQELIEADLKKEYALVKNCPTRWNCLLRLLSRFVKVKDHIHHALVDLRKADMFPVENDIIIIEDMVNTLESVEAVSLCLQDRAVTIAEADESFDFALKSLNHKADTSYFALQIRDSLLSRVLYRRNKSLTTLMSFLENRKFLKETDQVLPKATKEEMTEYAVVLYTRLFPEPAVAPHVTQVM